MSGPMFGPMFPMHGSMLNLMFGPMSGPMPLGGGIIIPICCPLVGSPMPVGGPVGGGMLHVYIPIPFCCPMGCPMPLGGVVHGHDCMGAPTPGFMALKGAG